MTISVEEFGGKKVHQFVGCSFCSLGLLWCAIWNLLLLVILQATFFQYISDGSFRHEIAWPILDQMHRPCAWQLQESSTSAKVQV